MGAKKSCDLLGASQQAAGSAGESTETFVYLSLSHRISAITCASTFMHGENAPCYDLQDRRAHAMAALYVEDFLSAERQGYHYDEEILSRIVASFMHVPYSLGHRMVRALVDVELLAVEDGGASWQQL